MSDNGFRIVALNALLVILLGMFAAGLPLVLVVLQEAYKQPATIHLGGDYRGWTMAHLEGLLNGLLMIAMAAATRFRPMSLARESWLVPALLVGGWGNAIAAILAPLWGVRGMTFDANLANNVVAAMFTAALVGAIVAMAISIAHLVGRKTS